MVNVALFAHTFLSNWVVSRGENRDTGWILPDYPSVPRDSVTKWIIYIRIRTFNICTTSESEYSKPKNGYGMDTNIWCMTLFVFNSKSKEKKTTCIHICTYPYFLSNFIPKSELSRLIWQLSFSWVGRTVYFSDHVHKCNLEWRHAKRIVWNE